MTMKQMLPYERRFELQRKRTLKLKSKLFPHVIKSNKSHELMNITICMYFNARER